MAFVSTVSIAILAFVDSIFIFGLGATGTALFAVAALLLSKNEISIYEIWIGAFVGAVIGDHVSYLFGRFAWAMIHARLGQSLKARLDRSRDFLAKYGIVGIVLGRFFWVTRKTVPLLCGSIGMPVWRFSIANIAACFLWVTFWCTVLLISIKYGTDLFGLNLGR